jgi:hypothetical protein
MVRRIITDAVRLTRRKVTCGAAGALLAGRLAAEQAELPAAEAAPANQATPQQPQQPQPPQPSQQPTFAAVEAVKLTAVPEGFEPVASTPKIKLYINRSNSQLIVEDLRNGKLWPSNPIGPSMAGIAESLRTRLESVFTVSYTNRQRQVENLTTNIGERAALSFSSIPNGIKVGYDMDKLKLKLSIEYRVNDDYLEVNVPDDEIKEEGEFKIVALEILPFFGAADDYSQGYLVIPDGAGAVIRFKREHPAYNQHFSQPVYGPEEHSWMPLTTEKAPMPVFGLVDGNAAFAAFVTQGEFDVRIKGSPSGYITNFYRGAAEFILRRQVSIPRRRGVYASRIQENRVQSPRTVRYVLLTESDANYVGIAKAYREYLMKEKGVPRLSQPGAPINIRLFMGVQRRALFLNEFIVMTTFDEARQILQELLDAGVKNMAVTLIGWSRGGYNGDYPRRFPVAKELGGEAGLRRLAQWTKQNNIKLYLEDDYLTAYRGNWGFIERIHVTRRLNRLPVFDDRSQPGQGQFIKRAFVLNPRWAYEIYAKNDIPKTRELGVDGLELRWFGEIAFIDTNEFHPFTREGYVNEYMERIVKLARENFGWVGVHGINTYTLGRVDKLVGVTNDSSRYAYADESVPFLQSLLHGLVNYDAPIANLRSDGPHDFLRQWETGGTPTFELTYRGSSELRRTAYNRLYSSYYKDWIDQIVKEYNISANQLGHVRDKFIVEHREVGRKVFRTRYEDGTAVYVNYSDQPFSDGQVRVESLGLAVVRGR